SLIYRLGAVVPRPAHQGFVAHGKNDAVFARAMLDPRPSGRGDGIAELPVERRLADGRATAAANDDVDRVDGLAERPIGVALVPAMHLKRDGGHLRCRKLDDFLLA